MRHVARLFSVFALLSVAACSAPLVGESNVPAIGGAAPSHLGGLEPLETRAADRASQRDYSQMEREPQARGGMMRMRDYQCWQCR
ncbi:MAG: hypothetical protein KC657_12415 [Myxococcales bacterium]|nr:hypothetical protein [Myxococcales bacterium]